MNYLLVHFLFSIFTPLLGIRKKTKTEYFIKVLLILGFPVGGFIIVIVMYLMDRSKVEKLDDDEFEDPIILFTDKIDVAREINILPIEELLNVKDLSMKRTQLINTLMEDFSSLIDKLKLALRDDDVETSHYAASAIAELKRDLDRKLLSMGNLYEKNPDDLVIIDDYMDVLVMLIDSQTYDQMSMLYFKETLIGLLQQRITLSKETDAKYYQMMIHYSIDLGNNEIARIYIEEHKLKFYNEDSFIYELELYYQQRDVENFKRVFNEMINSPIVLSNKGLNVVRFWMEGMKHGITQ